MYLVIVPRRTRSATCAQTVLIEKVSAVVRSTGPKLWLLSFESGTPEIVTGDLPLTTELGVNRPLSSAATSVTILKVEPGGYRPCVERFRVEIFAPVASGWLSS